MQPQLLFSPAHLTRNPAGNLSQLLEKKKSPGRDLTLGFKPHSRGFSQSIYRVYLFTVARACGHVWFKSADSMPTPQVGRFCRAGLCAHGVKGLVSARLWVEVAGAGGRIPHCNAASDGLITQQRTGFFPGTDPLGGVQGRTKKRGKVNENWRALKVENCPSLEVVLQHLALLLPFNQHRLH